MGTIPSSLLPSRTLWPERIHTLPGHASYPARLNSTEELIDRHVEAGHGDRVAVHEDQRITYRQLQGAVSRLGSALRALGIEKEDRVLLRGPSIPPSLVANVALIQIGGGIAPPGPAGPGTGKLLRRVLREQAATPLTGAGAWIDSRAVSS